MKKKYKKGLIMFMPFIGGGGVEKNLYLISNYFSKKIDNVIICTISKRPIKKFNKKISFLTPQVKFSNKINIRIQYLICLFLLYKFLRKNKNYVVFSFQANIYCILLCKLLKIKIIARSNSSPSGWYHNSFKKFIYKRIISQASEVIVNSFEFKKQMEKRFNIKTTCILNPLNKNEILKQSKERKSENFFVGKSYAKIINLGRFTEQKDQITILKAAKMLRKKIKFKLLIIGRGVEKLNLLDYIKKNKLKKFVQIRNFLENPYPIIKQSDIFVLSSKYEGLPNVLLEAATLKKFIISTDCPTGPREILSNGKGGFLFKISDHKELYKKILIYLKNKKKYQKKINFNFNHLFRYDYNKNLEQYFLLIEKYII